tara:strand:+ start:8100 stop:8981 length:882 start_codon:yes stop_codon:yes gene_type:complete
MYTLFQNSLKSSGNYTTIHRLKKILQLETSKVILNRSIGIHAYKFGKHIVDFNHKYILILGGTDVYVDPVCRDKFDIIKKTLEHAHYIIAFTVDMKARVIEVFNIDPTNIKIIPQSVPRKLKYDTSYNIRDNLPLDGKPFYIMVGDLRNIKRPEYLFDFFRSQKKIALVLIGTPLEGECVCPSNVFHIGPLKRKKIYAIMRQASGLINTSRHEGMSMSILEAMSTGCPVYAFKNPGNMAIITDNYNGYLFDTVQTLKFILRLPTKHIVKNALEYIRIAHSPILEKKAYLHLLD